MQCKKCGDNDFEQKYEEDPQPEIRMHFIESQFRCRTCGTVHYLKFNWEDFDFKTLPKDELVNP